MTRVETEHTEGLGDLLPDRSHAISRRQMLQRSLVGAGVVAWSVPTVQALAMSRAHAQTASPIAQVSGQGVSASAGAAGGAQLPFTGGGAAGIAALGAASVVTGLALGRAGRSAPTGDATRRPPTATG